MPLILRKLGLRWEQWGWRTSAGTKTPGAEEPCEGFLEPAAARAGSGQAVFVSLP